MDKATFDVLQHINKEIREMAALIDAHTKESDGTMKQIERQDDRDIMIQYAMSFIGTWYSWGGDDPMIGFDCSRFTGEAEKAVGLLSRGCIAPTAAGQWNKWQDKVVEKPYKGCLVFYHSKPDASKIIHIELCINERLSIGASGGGSKTRTKEDAIRDNAFIKIRPWNSRSRVRGFIDPFME